MRTSQYTGGDEVFPSGTTTCYKTGFTNVSVLIDFTANGNTGDFSKFEGELRAGSFTGNLTGNVTGNAASATKATQDGDGNVIADTYAKSSTYGYLNLIMAGANNISGIDTDKDVNGNVWNIVVGNSNIIHNVKYSIFAGLNNIISYAGECTEGSIVVGLNNQCSGGNNAMFGHYATSGAGSKSGADNTNAFIIGNGSSTARSNAARIDYNGKLWCKSAYSATGADYAELFEWQDGNPNNEDRRGYFVTMDGDKIRKAQAGDWILGIVSANPCVLGNTDTEWQGQFLKDEFGAYLTEEFTEMETRTRYVQEVDEVGNPVLNENGAQTEVPEEYEEEITGTRYVLNPDYDPDAPYVDRMSRPEWNAVGMMGVLAVYDDGTCEVNGFCSCGADGIATASDCGYRVVKRVTDNIVKVVFK